MDGESARVAEGVEHPAAGRDAPQGETMFPLVQEEPGLLALEQVHREPRRPLLDHHRSPQGALEQPVHRFQALLLAAALAALHEGGDPFPPAQLMQRRPPGVPQGFQPQGAHLDHQGRSVPVHHQPGQQVALPEHPAAPGRGTVQAQLAPDRQRLVQALLEEVPVQGPVLPGEQAHRQRAHGRGGAHPQHVAAGVRQARQGSRGRVRQGARVDPRVPLGQELFLAGLETDDGIGPAGGFHGDSVEHRLTGAGPPSGRPPGPPRPGGRCPAAWRRAAPTGPPPRHSPGR